MNFAVFVAPLYLGCCHDGWLEIIQQYPDGVKKSREYGQWFANRYKHLPNLVWISGGDHNAVLEAFAFAEGRVCRHHPPAQFSCTPGKVLRGKISGSKMANPQFCVHLFSGNGNRYQLAVPPRLYDVIPLRVE